MKARMSRRVFLERLGAGAGAAAIAGRVNRRTLEGAGVWAAPPVLTNPPNILLIMVDQMRSPMWLDSGQMSRLGQEFLPNIFGKLRNRSYNFQQYYVAATVCTASRATLLTGLYAPQTAVYVNSEQTAAPYDLNPAFPTWPEAVQYPNSAYQDNCWWFGKWHLSDCADSDPLKAYRLHTRTYPGGDAKNPSPDGHVNEGANGGPYGDKEFARDEKIAGDFIEWLEGVAPTPGPPRSPWCAGLSLVNPHDIGAAPGWLDPNNFPPPNLPSRIAFSPPTFPLPGGPEALYTSYPSSWNYENLQNVTTKPGVHRAFQDRINNQNGKVTDWIDFLNKYYWEQNLVDTQIGRVLSALDASGQANNTIILFTSDHGEYAGSHGLHAKGYTAYEEAIHVPLYVKFPGQTSSFGMNQMCSSVDVFGLICDLCTSTPGWWRARYPDLASRQSLWDFIYRNVPETRVAPGLGIPYILHTCDLGNLKGENGHVVCLRTKTDTGNAAQPGAKLAIYSSWDPCSTIPNSTPPDYEFYDYSKNRREVGNDYSSGQPTQRFDQYLNELGSWGPPATGLIADELNAPLIGTGTDGRPLTEAQAAARRNYYDAAAGPGACAAQPAAEAFAR